MVVMRINPVKSKNRFAVMGFGSGELSWRGSSKRAAIPKVYKRIVHGLQVPTSFLPNKVIKPYMVAEERAIRKPYAVIWIVPMPRTPDIKTVQEIESKMAANFFFVGGSLKNNHAIMVTIMGELLWTTVAMDAPTSTMDIFQKV